MMSAWWFRGGVALVVGCAIVLLGDWLLGVKIELFVGLATFNPRWILDVFLVPFISGTAVGMIYGLGGKWLCYFPPILVRIYSYYYLASINPSAIPDGASLMPMGWWGFFVILAFEAAAFGGVAGELLIKRTYGRLPRALVYKHKADSEPPKPEN